MLAELRERKGKVSLETGGASPAIAFATSAAYESAIARWFQRGDDFPETFVPAFDRVLELAYGENPHQRAAFYAERGHRGHVLSRVEQLAREAAVVQQPQRPLRGAIARARARRARVRDREAREPVRCRRWPPRSRRHTRTPSRPTRSRRTAGSSSSTARSPPPSEKRSQRSSSRCCSRPGTTSRRCRRCRGRPRSGS